MLRTKLVSITVAILSILVAVLLMAPKPPDPPPEPAGELISLDIEAQEIGAKMTFRPTAIDVSDVKFISLLGRSDVNLELRFGFLAEAGTTSDNIPRTLSSAAACLVAPDLGLHIEQSGVCNAIPVQGPFFAIAITNTTDNPQIVTLKAWLQK